MESSFKSEGKSDEAYLQEFKSRVLPNDQSSKKVNSPMPADILAMPGLVTWAVVGDMLDRDKPASSVAAAIEAQGRTVYRISPTLDAAAPKRRLYKRLADVPADARIDAVNLCAHYRIGLATLPEMRRRGIRHCVLQPGADDEALRRRAAGLGIAYQRGCMIARPLRDLTKDEKRRAKETQGAKTRGCGCAVS